MKRNRLIVLALMLIGLMNAQKVCAWDGSTPDAIAKASGDAAEFYLYNVGTRQFLTQGGSWGTAAVVAGDGIRFRGLTKSGSSYIFNTPLKETSTMILSTGSSTKNPYYLFLDQTRLDIYTFTVASVTGESNVYTISAEQTNANQGVAKGTYYISVDADGNCKAVALDENDDNRKWMFVTLKEIKDNFDNTHGTEANPAYAPHLLSDAGFYRENGSVSAWKLGEKRSTDVGNYYIYSVNDEGTITGTSIGYNENLSDNDYKNGLKPADALGGTTTTPALYNYEVECTYTYKTFWGSTKEDKHTVSKSSETPLYGLTEEKKSKDIPSSDFFECGEEHTISRQTITLKSITPESTKTKSGYTYYVGNGYNMYKTSGQQTFEDGNIYNDTHYQEPFGGYWTANIHGTEGSISQQITPGRKGWWKVSAKGFSNDGTGNLFAYAGGTNQTNTDKFKVQPFNKVDTAAVDVKTYVKASKYLNTTESQSVTVYVDADETLTFGAYIKEGEGTEKSWTCFDDFTLAYLGEGELNLIIDETNEEIANINGQSNTEKNQTLRLTRSFKTDKWNSLVLPVKLTAQQVKTAFGADTKLSALDRTELDGKRIFFEKVDLRVDDADAIEAGKLYIIKPQNPMPTEQAEKTRTLNGENAGTITSQRSYYTINQVSLTSDNLTADVEDIGFVESTVDHGIKMVGTYVYQKSTDGHSIPANSYILSDGTWYYHTAGVKNVKGLRGWIQTSAAPSGTKFFINGVEEGEATAIEGIENSMEVSKRINSNIYNLNGQLVRSNSVSAEGLDKGIYIIGGKKVVVK